MARAGSAARTHDAMRVPKQWYVYILECSDGSLYTGISTDVARRFAQHHAGTGARYTRSRPPLRVLAQFAHPDQSAASRAEHAIKQLSASHKRALCDATAAPLSPLPSR